MIKMIVKYKSTHTRDYIRNQIIMDKTTKWLHRWYLENKNLDVVWDFDWTVRPTASGSTFKHWKNRKIRPQIHIGGKQPNFWVTYYRPSIGIFANHIPCPNKTILELHWIHELTHFIQYFRKDKNFGEVETTRMEMIYALWNHKYLFDQLTSIEKYREEVETTRIKFIKLEQQYAI